MKNLQQNLFVAIALGLCALCVYQWRGQTVQRGEIERLDHLVYEKATAIQTYTNSIAAMDQQIAQMDQRLAELKASAATNASLIRAQQGELGQLRATAAGLTNIISQYTNAVSILESRLKEANASILLQNDSLQKLVAQRDELVKKYNDSVQDRNEVVRKYNELVHQIETNSIPATPAARR